jgi:hypothetical protein
MIRRAAILLLAVGTLLAAPLGVRAVQKGASITVRARWQGTPYLLEAAEFLVRAYPQRACPRAASPGAAGRGSGSAGRHPLRMPHVPW